MNKSLTNVGLLIVFFLSVSNVQAQDEPRFVMTQIGSNRIVDNPNDLNYGPDGFLWVSERERGVIVRIDPATGARDEVVTIPNVLSTSRQEGLLGFAFHQDFASNPFVYLSYTRDEQGVKLQRLARYTYSQSGEDGVLNDPVTILDDLPATNDHNSGRIVFGPDEKLYYSIGDHGHNQGRNYCDEIRAQFLPSQAEVDAQDWVNYPGSILRLNVDGSIPADNPVLDGVQSHIFSYGHRNPQGLSFSESGKLYSSEHGPETDDEVNLIAAGNNYGWPIVVGFQDDQAYDYCNWSMAPDCENLTFDVFNCPAGTPQVEENTMTDSNYTEPLAALFAVTDDYDFNDPQFESSYWARPNVAPPSIEVYESDAIPSWKGSLLIPSLKRGRIYRLKLNADGTAVEGDTIQHFYTPNRYRDIALDPDGKSFYIVTDESGNVSDISGLRRANPNRRNPSAILKFTLDESSSATEVKAGDVFTAWPNPAHDQLNVNLLSTSSQSTSATLLNMTGQTVMQINSLKRGNNVIQLESLFSGVYLLRVNIEGRTFEQRIVIQR